MTILLQISAHLVALEVLERTGNFADAARELEMSKAALSVRISRLEQLLGIPLLEQRAGDRRNKQVTAAGRALARRMRYARSILENELIAIRASVKRQPARVSIAA